MTTRVFGIIGLATGCLLLASGETKPDEPRQKAQSIDTRRMEFPAGGEITLRNSAGALTVEAWDQPAVEITTIKSSKREYEMGRRAKELRKLEKVRIGVERTGNRLVVTTDYRNHLAGKPGFDLEYRIKAPATVRIFVKSRVAGDVNIEGLTGDIDVSLLRGDIMLHLPEEGRYSISAKSNFGGVLSDFPGPDLNSTEKRRLWLFGHVSASENGAAPHKLRLKVAFGDIVILKTRIPKAPDSLVPAPKTEGL